MFRRFLQVQEVVESSGVVLASLRFGVASGWRVGGDKVDFSTDIYIYM